MLRFLLFLCFPLHLLAQALTPEQVMSEKVTPQVTAIHTEFESGYGEDGFGLVTGARDGKLFIATAAHVVEQSGESATIKVRFRDDYREYSAALIRSNSEWDLALLECDAPSAFQRDPAIAGRQVERGDRALYVGRNGEWYVPTEAAYGTVNQVRNDRIYVDVIGLSRGTSGAPLFTAQGVAGIIIEAETSQATAVQLDKAIDLLTNYGQYPFLLQLTEASSRRNTDSQSDRTNTPESTTRDMMEQGFVTTQFQLPGFEYVAGGRYARGCTPGQHGCGADEKPMQRVDVSSFFIMQHEVTRAYWQEVVGDLPRGNDPACMECPVVNVTYDEAVAFARRMQRKLDWPYVLRLPTEAEWEYAARGGQQSQNTLFAGSNTIYEVAHFISNSKNDVQVVGLLAPNELGLYDMSGNVEEWCQDWYARDVYASGQVLENPAGPDQGTARVVRGGSVHGLDNDCRVARRKRASPGKGDPYRGFRLVYRVR